MSTAEFTVPYASGLFSYQDVSVPAVTLPAGPVWMRVVIDDDYPATLDFFRLTPGTLLPTASGLTLSPSTVAGGGSAGGTVTLSGPAPGTMALALSSDNPAAQVPASVTVYAGSATGYFTVTTSPVTAAATARITASGAGGPVGAALTLAPSVSLSSIYVFWEEAISLGGGPASPPAAYGNFTLNGPAPAGGLTVTLTSDCAAATVPPTVTVPAGSSWGSFAIGTSAVTTPVTAHITASAGGAAKEADLALMPFGLAGLSVSPGTVHGGDPANGYVTLTGPAPAGGLAVGLSSDSGSATVPSSVTVPAGQGGVSFTVTTSAVASAQTATITATGTNGPLSAPLTLSTMSAPSGLTATANPTGPASVVVSLNWTAAAGAAGYAVERSPDLSAWTQIGTAPGTSYQDATAAGGTQYWYRVKSAGGSAYSNTAYAATGFPWLVATDLDWTPDPVHAGDQVHFYAVIQNIGTATSYPFTWTVEFEGDLYGGFNIEANPLAPGDTLLVTENTSQFWTATPGTYHPTVVIDDSYGTLLKTLIVAPDAPTGLTATAVSSTEIDLSWQTSPGATSYNLYRGTSSGAETLYQSGLTGTSFADTPVTSGQAYYYQVTAAAAGTESARSPEAAAGGAVAAASGSGFGFETPVVGAGAYQAAPSGSPWTFGGGAGISGNGSAFTSGNPPAPEGVQVGEIQGVGTISQPLTSSAAGGWTVTFSAAQRGNGGGQNQAVQVLLDGTVVGTVVGTVTPTGTGYADYGVGPVSLPAGTHTLSFAGTDPFGGDNTAFIDNVRVRVSATTGLPAPTGLNATAVSGTEINLAWSASAGAAGYAIERSPDGSTNWVQVGTAMTPSYPDRVLTAGTKYYYRVRYTAGSSISPPGNTASATTLFAGPTNLTAMAGDGSVSLTWIASEGAADYQIYRSDTPNGEGAVPFKVGINSCPYVDTGLTNGTTYYYKIAATNGLSNESAEAGEASATPIHSVAPTTHLTASQAIQTAEVFCSAIGASVSSSGQSQATALYPAPADDGVGAESYWLPCWQVRFGSEATVNVVDADGTITFYINSALSQQLYANSQPAGTPIAEENALSIASSVLQATGQTQPLGTSQDQVLQITNAPLSLGHLWRLTSMRQCQGDPYEAEQGTIMLNADTGAVQCVVLNFPSPPPPTATPVVTQTQAQTTASAQLNNSGVTGVVVQAAQLCWVQGNTFWTNGGLTSQPGAAQLVWSMIFAASLTSTTDYEVWIDAQTGSIVGGCIRQLAGRTLRPGALKGKTTTAAGKAVKKAAAPKHAKTRKSR